MEGETVTTGLCSNCGWRTSPKRIFFTHVMAMISGTMYVIVYMYCKLEIFSTNNWLPQRVSNTTTTVGTFSEVKIPNKLLLAIVAAFCLLIFIGSTIMALYSNCSRTVSMQLLKEPRTIIILILHFINVIINMMFQDTATSWTDPFILMTATINFIFMDAMHESERWFRIANAVMLCITILFLLFDRMIMMTDVGVVLVEFNSGITIYKRNSQITIFTNMATLLSGALLSIIQDKKHERFIFLQGHLYRKTGTPSKTQFNHKYIERRKSEVVPSSLKAWE